MPRKNPKVPKPTKMCAYCGLRPAKEMEHVVAKAFFDVLPLRNITVPACTECNQFTGDGGLRPLHQDETYMRNVIGMANDTGSHPEAKKLFTGKISRSLEKDRGSVMPVFTATFRKSELNREGYLVEMPVFEVDFRRIYRVVRKITRGLFYHHFDRMLPSNYDVFYFRGARHEFSRLSAAPGKPSVIYLGNGEFSYWIEQVAADTNHIQCYMLFFGGFELMSFTAPQANAAKYKARYPKWYPR